MGAGLHQTAPTVQFPYQGHHHAKSVLWSQLDRIIEVPLQQNLMEAISLTEVCKKYCKQQEKVASIDCDKIIKKSKYITVVECLSSEQFKEVIADQRKEAAEIKEVVCLNNDQKLLQDYVDSILDEDVIAIIKRKIWKL
ncbi:hypothetical protein PPYR_00902 [Photinus pyralis]|uniref:Uncharacterized protein n=1 Tax=Photinus pyralis TaxID=7054 RepID=A0A5N4B2V2_PHOPY|nr:hypothetical protein PPYR_00902 [Photinus pyralis]